MTKEQEAIFDRARFVKAGFFGAARSVLEMHARGNVRDKRALDMLNTLLEDTIRDTQPAEDLLKQLIVEFQTKPESGLIDDVPLI